MSPSPKSDAIKVPVRPSVSRDSICVRLAPLLLALSSTACAAAFVQAIEKCGMPPIPFAEVMEVSRVSIQVAQALR